MTNVNLSDREHVGGGERERGVHSRRNFFGPLFLEFPDFPLGNDQCENV